MKLQNLAIIFIIIILPISVVLTSYVSANMKTIELQLLYDMKLKEATYEAIQAFQLNTVNSGTSTLADSKIRDIQASVNSFFTAIESKFSMNGYNKEALQDHIPALVYTLYDGYYIYAPFENAEKEPAEGAKEGITYEKGTIYDLKPYVYYSCRYMKGTTIDVIITYSLDSYVTISGMYNGKPIELSGYLLTDVEEKSDGIYYRDNRIDEEHLKEMVIFKDGEAIELPYRKINGTKYYVAEGKDNNIYRLTSNGILEPTRSVPGAGPNLQDRQNYIKNNTNAQEYYRQAANLKSKIINGEYKELSSLTIGDAVDENGDKIFYDASITDHEKDKYKDYRVSQDQANTKIFGELSGGSGQKSIEDAGSNFDTHRISVIKYCIEKNLAVAISNFHSKSDTSTSFEMPKLRDEEWDRLTGNIGMISFLQGLHIGSKTYNGYAVINNSQNEEFVSEDSIYIETLDNNNNSEYHRVEDKEITNNKTVTGAHFNINYIVKTMAYVDTNDAGEQFTRTKYYYPRKALACYHCLVEQDTVDSTNTKKDILKNNTTLAKFYYTALARERYGQYRVEKAF